MISKSIIKADLDTHGITIDRHSKEVIKIPVVAWEVTTTPSTGTILKPLFYGPKKLSAETTPILYEDDTVYDPVSDQIFENLLSWMESKKVKSTFLVGNQEIEGILSLDDIAYLDHCSSISNAANINIIDIDCEGESHKGLDFPHESQKSTFKFNGISFRDVGVESFPVVMLTRTPS